MGSPHRVAEMAFELALTSALEDGHGLSVRVDGDALNRRQNGYATLAFEYEHPASKRAKSKVRVSIKGGPGERFAFLVDLHDREAMESVAGSCEDLAFAVHTYLEEHGKPLALAHDGLRWDD